MGRRGREKFNVGSASRRRVVLQIEPVSRKKENEGSHLISRKREINPTSISGIGLLGQYAEDSDDEEQKGSSSDEENRNEEEKTKPSDEVQIDSKLNDFFKEIEAMPIGTEDSNSTEFIETTSQTTTVDAPTLEEQADASVVDQNVQGDVLPEPWQEVRDASTNYIYYWNTLTNEVSWEFPQVFGPIQAPTPAIDQVEQNTSQKEVDKESQNLIEYQSSVSDEETSTESKDDNIQVADGERTVTASCVADEESPIQGPATLPPASDPGTSEQAAKDTTSSSTDNLGGEYLDEKKQELGHTSSCEGSPIPESLNISRKRERSSAIDMFESEARQDDSNENESEEQHPLDYWDEERMKNAVAEEMPEYPPTPENLDVSPRSLPDEDQRDGDKSTALDGEQDGKETFGETNRSEKEDVSDDESDPVVPAKKAKFEEESDHESEGDFAEKLLEEFLEGKTADAASSGDDMEVDSDDQQDAQEEVPLLPPEAFLHNRADRLEEDGGASPADVSRPQVEVDKRTEEENEKLTTEIHDLCQLLSNKLEFLNINKDGVNKLLIVLVQMETRIKDWREGGLSGTYIVKKLREAAQDLRSYEQSAVPEGWSCHWDSTYKRYFYTNDKTGESQWDYPQTSTDSSSVEKQKMVSVPDNGDAIGSWETSVIKETTSSLKPSLESHLYPSNIGSTAAYPVVTPSPIIVPTNIGQEIASLGPAMSETNYNMLTSSVDPDPDTATIYPVFQPSQNTAPTDVTKDPYRLDDDSPPASENSIEHGPTPPPPGLSPPPPPPTDVQTIPPPPPPQDPPPLPPPVVPSVSEKSSNQAEQVETGSIKHGVIQRPLIDYSDLDGPLHLPNTNVQASGSSRSSPIPMQTTTKQKKKKSKSSSVPIRTSKVKQMSSLVQKWQAIKRQEEVLSEDESDEEDYGAKNEAQIEQWRQEQITSGLAADNPNFQKITGDWRERVRKAKQRTGTLAETE